MLDTDAEVETATATAVPGSACELTIIDDCDEPVPGVARESMEDVPHDDHSPVNAPDGCYGTVPIDDSR
jgi:hypothetical protein